MKRAWKSDQKAGSSRYGSMPGNGLGMRGSPERGFGATCSAYRQAGGNAREVRGGAEAARPPGPRASRLLPRRPVQHTALQLLPVDPRPDPQAGRYFSGDSVIHFQAVGGEPVDVGE